MILFNCARVGFFFFRLRLHSGSKVVCGTVGFNEEAVGWCSPSRAGWWEDDWQPHGGRRQRSDSTRIDSSGRRRSVLYATGTLLPPPLVHAQSGLTGDQTVPDAASSQLLRCRRSAHDVQLADHVRQFRTASTDSAAALELARCQFAGRPGALEQRIVALSTFAGRFVRIGNGPVPSAPNGASHATGLLVSVASARNVLAVLSLFRVQSVGTGSEQQRGSSARCQRCPAYVIESHQSRSRQYQSQRKSSSSSSSTQFRSIATAEQQITFGTFIKFWKKASN